MIKFSPILREIHLISGDSVEGKFRSFQKEDRVRLRIRGTGIQRVGIIDDIRMYDDQSGGVLYIRFKEVKSPVQKLAVVRVEFDKPMEQQRNDFKTLTKI